MTRKQPVLMRCLLLLALLWAVSLTAGRAQLPEPNLAYILHPDYRLPGNAASYPGPRPPVLRSRTSPVALNQPEILLFGHHPTQRIRNLGRDTLPAGPFTAEMWILYHVNQAVGVLAAARHPDPAADPLWTLGMYGNRMLFQLGANPNGNPLTLEAPLDRGWKRYWLHLAATYDGETARLYLNGKLKKEGTVPFNHSMDGASVELAGYMADEPYMEVANLLKQFRLYDRALSHQDIVDRLADLQGQVEQAFLFPDAFHFLAGPYLHHVTPNEIRMSWETDRPTASAVLKYGTRLPLEHSAHLPSSGGDEQGKNCINAFSLRGLRAGTPYFYRLELTDHAGQAISSGTLTFATAPAEAGPFTFAVLGDTEARPHINARLAGQIWDERPNFLLNLGDLTDGGQQAHKFEWTYEYFTGMTPLASRVPVFPVVGNGESDLHWFQQYHALPEGEAFYHFTYGDAEFFMLNSNRRDEFAPGGKQYQWLEKKLRASKARWKFVCHHHAPYSSDENDYGNSWEGPSALGDTLVRRIVPLYEKYGVDMVLFGHLHTYQRTLPMQGNEVRQDGGVVYVQAGGGGGNLEDFAPTRSWFSAKTYRGHHYLTVSVDNDRLELRSTDAEGRLRDLFTMQK